MVSIVKSTTYTFDVEGLKTLIAQHLNADVQDIKFNFIVNMKATDYYDRTAPITEFGGVTAEINVSAEIKG